MDALWPQHFPLYQGILVLASKQSDSCITKAFHCHLGIHQVAALIFGAAFLPFQIL
jgi:hypothetical protein